MDFQPVIETQVSSKFVQAGTPFTDQLAVTATKHSWINVNGSPVPVLADGTLYGPFDAQPAEASAPPAGAPVLGTETLTLTHPGNYVSPGTLVAPSSGFYTWVWSIDKQKQGENAKYLTDSFTDRFGRVAESSVAPFQPEAVSKANGRLVTLGDAVTDTITVSSTKLVQGTDIPKGAYLVFRAYGPQPAGDAPVCEVPFFSSAKVPVTQARHYRSDETTVDKPGNVYWVETLYDQDGKVIASGKCGAPGETTVVTERPPGTPPTPPVPQPPLPKPPTSLAQTGSDGWMSLVWGGIAAALLATGGTLWFGRRLALYLERNGYVREEDTGIEDLMNK
ncbi:hypothetical protein XM48_06840 [Leucobacter sp. Ag1]|nr:hypothetical protein XM48_06840 [Leucobacter sp. Ag1]